VPLNIKHPEADRLARQLASKTGETITEAVINALRDPLAREEGRASVGGLREELLAIGRRCAALPDRDTRSAEEILGYDELCSSRGQTSLRPTSQRRSKQP
jgi:antitoxin VapB